MAMTRGQIEKAREKALEFVAHCELLLTRLDADLQDRRHFNTRTQEWETEDRKPSPTDHSWGCKESGALRRNSMDLTRMLANLRRPQ